MPSLTTPLRGLAAILRAAAGLLDTIAGGEQSSPPAAKPPQPEVVRPSAGAKRTPAAARETPKRRATTRRPDRARTAAPKDLVQEGSGQVRPTLASKAAKKLRISSGYVENGDSTSSSAITSIKNDGLTGFPFARFQPLAIFTRGTHRPPTSLFLAVACSLCLSGLVLIQVPITLSGIS